MNIQRKGQTMIFRYFICRVREQMVFFSFQADGVQIVNLVCGLDVMLNFTTVYFGETLNSVQKYVR